MLKVMSKQSFFQKLSFGLAFHYNDAEVANILNDYEEWFANESLQGKSEEEICRNLGPVNKIIKNLLSENRSSSSKMAIMAHNLMVPLLLLTILRFFAEIILLQRNQGEMMNGFIVSVLVNLIYFILGVRIIWKKSDTYRIRNQNRKKENIVIFALVTAVILFQILILPKSETIYFGKICVILSGVLAVLLFLISIYFSTWKLVVDRQGAFVTMIHISGMISVLLLMINQLHSLSDISEYMNSVLGSVVIYIETLVLCFILFKRLIGKREVWIHN